MTYNKLNPEALDWALEHLSLEGDGDIFPKPFEIEILKQGWPEAKEDVGKIDVSAHKWEAIRRALVPKDGLTFRRACQLQPLDALLFSALMYDIGPILEQRRRPVAEKTVFSYRFQPRAILGRNSGVSP